MFNSIQKHAYFCPVRGGGVRHGALQLMQEFCDASFLDKHGIISPSQYDSVKGRGTLSLLEVFSDSLHSSFDNQFCVRALFLDVAKAFDSVNHEILLSKLYHPGFSGPFFCSSR